jgi:hypothetical protein
MAYQKSAASTDTLVTLLKSMLATETEQVFGHLVLYMAFGVVRGRTGIAFSEVSIERAPGEGAAANGVAGSDVIELHDVTVEHYSNHLATATFDNLYVRLAHVYGFAFVKPPA